MTGMTFFSSIWRVGGVDIISGLAVRFNDSPATISLKVGHVAGKKPQELGVDSPFSEPGPFQPESL